MPAVVDTNVLLVANEQHDGVSPACVAECVRRLQEMQQGGVVVIDDGYRILTEYRKKTEANSAKRVGDVFLKWLFRHQANAQRVHRVRITETGADVFSEFPDPGLQGRFDASDRKFVAVAHAHAERPPIWQAADCKWLDWWPELAVHGVTVEFLCPEDVCRFYAGKFRDRSVPALPGG